MEIQALPEFAQWSEVEIVVEYGQDFLQKFNDYPETDRRRIVKALRILTESKEGPRYPSLDTKRPPCLLPNAPVGCWASKATDEIRFLWGKEGETLKVYNLFRRGERGFYYSEA